MSIIPDGSTRRIASGSSTALAEGRALHKDSRRGPAS